MNCGVFLDRVRRVKNVILYGLDLSVWLFFQFKLKADLIISSLILEDVPPDILINLNEFFSDWVVYTRLLLLFQLFSNIR